MNREEFFSSLEQEKVPPGLSPELEALWHAGKSNMTTAHEMVRYEPDADSARIHAYLHRRTGETLLAEELYSKAGITAPTKKSEDEFSDLIDYFISKTSHCMLDF